VLGAPAAETEEVPGALNLFAAARVPRLLRLASEAPRSFRPPKSGVRGAPYDFAERHAGAQPAELR